MKKREPFTLEPFIKIRKQKKGEKFNLRLKLTLTVTLEMLVCTLIAYGIDVLLNKVIFKDYFQIPWLIEMAVISLIIGIFVTRALAKWFFNPIQKLRDAMDKVSEGDFSVQLTTRSTAKEIREVYSGFNMMMNEINSTEILQSNFVSNVSHEFKTPINAIEGYSMLLQGFENLTDEQREYVDKIVFNTKRLSSLTGSILLLSKLENQQIPLNKTSFSLDEQIRQAIVELEIEWEKKNIEFDVDMISINYFGNEALLRHVWHNILSNAIKFSPNDSIVTVSLKKEKSKIFVSFADDGPGLSEESKKRIFDKFYQGDTSHKEEGNGLGLSLAKKIVSLEEGEIIAENIASGGCKFTVILSAKK